ncbi:hypothetical protein M569_13604 [Genlisea aurea]|uniref:Uncharacterized protein n=1 Tax=Genlisea aurea TaxID=192259 RepID=S8CA10_9LAMI|nr:hypothetical protein M569_13604 [Genlisea aurea]
MGDEFDIASEAPGVDKHKKAKTYSKNRIFGSLSDVIENGSSRAFEVLSHLSINRRL